MLELEPFFPKIFICLFVIPDTLIARMTKQSVADVGGPWIEEEQRWGGAGSAHLKLSYRVTCAAHYYGAGCEVLCRPRDDAFGHYTCSPSGGIVCKAGWTGDYCSKRKYHYILSMYNNKISNRQHGTH